MPRLRPMRRSKDRDAFIQFHPFWMWLGIFTGQIVVSDSEGKTLSYREFLDKQS